MARPSWPSGWPLASRRGPRPSPSPPPGPASSSSPGGRPAAPTACSFAASGLDFLLVAGGGIVVGLVMVFTVMPLWSRLKDASIQITFSVLIPYGVYILAEEPGRAG